MNALTSSIKLYMPNIEYDIYVINGRYATNFYEAIKITVQRNLKMKTFNSYPIEPALRFCMTLLKSVPGTE